MCKSNKCKSKDCGLLCLWIWVRERNVSLGTFYLKKHRYYIISIAYFSRRDNSTWGGFGFVCVYAFFTIDHFNDRVRCLFSIAEVDKGNTPVELNPITEAGKGISPKLTGNEMMTRLICLITLILSWVCERRLLGIFVATNTLPFHRS